MFISHAGEQKPFARDLRDSLASIGIRAFVDQEDLRGGDHAVDIMLDCARCAPVGVAVFSPEFFDKAMPQCTSACVLQRWTV